MKTGQFLVVLLVSSLASYVFFSSHTPPKPSVPVAAVNPVPGPDLSENGKRQRQLQYLNTPRYEFRGMVVERLKDGLLLVSAATPMHNSRQLRAGGFAVIDYPNAANLANGSELGAFLGCVIGNYKYTSANGQDFTYPEIMYSDRDAFDELPKWDRYGHAINRDPSAPLVIPEDPQQSRTNPLNLPAHY